MKKIKNLLSIFFVGIVFMFLPIINTITHYKYIISSEFLEGLTALFYFIGLILVISIGPIIVIQALMNISKREE